MQSYPLSLYHSCKENYWVNHFWNLVKSVPSYERFHPQHVWGFLIWRIAPATFSYQFFFLFFPYFFFFFSEKYGKTALQMSVKVMSTIAVEQRWQDKHTKQCLSFYKKPFCPDCKSGIQGVFTVNGLLFRVHIITGNLYIACWNLPKIEMIRFMLCCSVAAFSHFKIFFFSYLPICLWNFFNSFIT